MMWFALN